MNNILFLIYDFNSNIIVCNNIINDDEYLFDFNEYPIINLNKLNNLLNNNDIIITFNVPYFISNIKNIININLNNDNYIEPIYYHNLEELNNKFCKNYSSRQYNKILFLDFNVLQNIFNISKTLNSYNITDYILLFQIMRDILNVKTIRNLFLNIKNNSYYLNDKLENKCILYYRKNNIDYFNYSEGNQNDQ